MLLYYRHMGYSFPNFKVIMRFLPLIALLFLAGAALAADLPAGHTLEDEMLYRINFGSADDVRVLLDKGADANATNKQGETALEIAIERNDAEASGIAMVLIEKGADF